MKPCLDNECPSLTRHLLLLLEEWESHIESELKKLSSKNKN